MLATMPVYLDQPPPYTGEVPNQEEVSPLLGLANEPHKVAMKLLLMGVDAGRIFD